MLSLVSTVRSMIATIVVVVLLAASAAHLFLMRLSQGSRGRCLLTKREREREGERGSVLEDLLPPDQQFKIKVEEKIGAYFWCCCSRRSC